MAITSATRSRLGAHLTERLSCWRRVAVPPVQTASAAGLSWFVAVHLFGHRAPLFAPVAAIVGIDMTLGQRLRRAIELIVGASAGVGISALLISAIGTGPGQIAVVVGLATSVAVLLNGRAVINVQAAVSAVLVATLSVPGDSRGLDRLIGAADRVRPGACAAEGDAVSPDVVEDHIPRSTRGSRVSRSQSPTTLMPSTTTRIASPGKSASHQPVVR
jgi:Fusaric acid resistance protein-like